MLGLTTIERPMGYFVVPLTIVEVFRHITETNVCALIVSIISIAFLITIKVNDENCTYNVSGTYAMCVAAKPGLVRSSNIG